MNLSCKSKDVVIDLEILWQLGEVQFCRFIQGPFDKLVDGKVFPSGCSSDPGKKLWGEAESSLYAVCRCHIVCHFCKDSEGVIIFQIMLSLFLSCLFRKNVLNCKIMRNVLIALLAFLAALAPLKFASEGMTCRFASSIIISPMHGTRMKHWRTAPWR